MGTGCLRSVKPGHDHLCNVQMRLPWASAGWTAARIVSRSAVGIDRPVREHQLPAFTGSKLGFDGIEQEIRARVGRAELAALFQAAPGDEECAFNGATDRHALPTQRSRRRSVRRARLASCSPRFRQFFSTMRPTTLPARSSSIHFWTSPIGSSRIGVGLILPARASAISSWASASVPTMKPSMVMRL